MRALADVKGFVFDLDGTLVHANGPEGVRDARPIPGSVEVLERVRRSGRPMVCFTNGTGRTPREYAADLRDLGFPVADREFMNPTIVATSWLLQRAAAPSVLVLAGRGVKEPLAEAGIRVLSSSEVAVPDFVLVGWDTELTHDAFTAACRAVWGGARLLVTATGPAVAVKEGLAPGWPTAIAAGIAKITGRRARTLGKPATIAFDTACAALGVPPQHTAIVGDDLELEIAMGRRAGARAVLVLSGTGSETAARKRDPLLQPSLVVRDVSELLDLL